MSNTQVKIMAATSTDELEGFINQFLSKENIEVKQFNYATDGYEKPYSAAILYHEKEQPRNTIEWHGKVKKEA